MVATGSTITDQFESDIAREEARLRAEKDAAYELAVRRPTITNRKAYAAKEKDLADFLKALTEPEPGERIFKGVLEVLEYLEGEHWKIGKTKLYDDFNQGLLVAQPAGTILMGDVLDYARRELHKQDGTSGVTAGGSSLQEQKILEEIGRIRADRLQREMKLKESTGELIKKSEVEIQFAKRIIYLKSDLKNIFRAGAVEIIRMVDGDPQKAALLIGYGVRIIDEAMDRYARPIRVDEE